MDNSNNELNTKNDVQDKSVENRAVISMVLGIASIVGCSFMVPIALVCGIIAMVMASKIQKDSNTNNGFAKAGFITGLVGTILTTLVLIFTILLLVVGKNVFNKYSDGYFGKFMDRLFDVVEKAEDYETDQREDEIDHEDKEKDEELTQKDSKLEAKKEKLDELKKEMESLKNEILTVKNSDDITKLSELQQKLVKLTEEIMELESEIIELED